MEHELQITTANLQKINAAITGIIFTDASGCERTIHPWYMSSPEVRVSSLR